MRIIIITEKWKNEMFDTKKYCVCVFLYLYNIYHKKNKYKLKILGFSNFKITQLNKQIFNKTNPHKLQ